jgi:tetratricopeptide (TPR) repeat protein
MGRLEDAITIARRAAALQPSLSAGYNTLGDVLMASGAYDEAIKPLRAALRFTPGLDPALERLELACHRSGRADESLAARRALLGHRGETARTAALEEDIARFGWSAARELDLRRDLARQLDRATREDPFVDQGRSRQLSDDIICLYADLGEWSRAMDWVERGYHRRPGRLRRVLMDFPYDRRGLGVDPRFAPLLRTAGLEELL